MLEREINELHHEYQEMLIEKSKDIKFLENKVRNLYLWLAAILWCSLIMALFILFHLI